MFYRKKQLSSQESAEIRQVGRAIVEIAAVLGSRFKPIPMAVPRFNSDPAKAAQIVRSQLGVSPDGPIVGLIRKLEKIGVLVAYLPTEVDGFDGFSAWSDEEHRRPIIALKPGRSGDRVRRTVAHELGHLVLHQDFLGSADVEDDAFVFCSELMIPSAQMQQELVPPLTLSRLAESKRRWGMSIQEIAHAACQRGIINERQKRYMRAKLADRGWLESEPVQIPVEYPRLFSQMVDSAYPNRKEAVRALSRETGYPASLIESILVANSAKETGAMAEAGPPHAQASGSVLSFPSRSAQARG
jgi:Zn-dependent peptidase ImmA (M78 family)